MQLITELAATVSCLVCSKSSGAPLGKMRGLITVKLANEQVNYRTKFLCKDCHFSERCSCSKEPKEKWEEEEERRQRTDFSFQGSSPVCALLSSEDCRLRLWGNGCINELLFLFQRTLPPLPTFSFPLTPFPSLRRLHQTPHSSFLPAHRLSSFTSQEPWGGFRFLFYSQQPRREGISDSLQGRSVFARCAELAGETANAVGERRWISLADLGRWQPPLLSLLVSQAGDKERRRAECSASLWPVASGCLYGCRRRVCVGDVDGFRGQMCMKSGANGVRSRAAGGGQGAG